MSSIDKRVVEAQFDNKQFESGIKDTLGSLARLKQGLKLDGATRGLSYINDVAQKTSLGGLISGVSNAASEFSLLKIVGVGALLEIGKKAVDAGLAFTKALTIGPISQGYGEFELKMGSIQTIMSGSGESLEVVNQKLDDLNQYADRTIYSFADMTSNIGKFTNAGVNLDQAVGAIQGISNAAALAGANAGEASRAMYNFAQAISAGHVKLIDWKSIELANMATKEFKEQLIEGAFAAGTLTKDAEGLYHTLEKGTEVNFKSFNQTLTEQWLTSEALIDTLGKYSDETTDIGQRAAAAATDVKTFTQMIDTMKEAVGSGWAQSFELIFGDFEEGKKLWTGINDVVGGFIGMTSDARNNVLSTWKELGGRSVLIEGLKFAFEDLLSVIRPFIDAFKEMVPVITGMKLYNLTDRFRDFFEEFKMGEGTLDNMKRAFKGVLAVFGIAWEIIKGIDGVVGDVFKKLTSNSGDLLGVMAGVGDFLVALYDKIKSGESIAGFFDDISDRISRGLDLISEFARKIFSFSGIEFDFKGFSTDQYGPSLDALTRISDTGIMIWDKISTVVVTIANKIGDISRSIGGFLSDVPTKVSDFFAGFDWGLGLSAINTGLFAGLLGIIKKFVDNMKSSRSEGGLFGSIKDSFGALTGSLEEMQKTLRATTLLQIAIAVGIMAASATALAKIDAADLAKALGAMATMFAQLFISLAAFNKIGGAIGLSTTATGLILLATAIRVMVSSVKAMAELSYEEMNRGLIGVTALISGLIIATQGMSGNTAGMITAGAGLTILAAGIMILVSAVTDLSGLSWEEMGKGLTGVGALLVALTLFTKFSAANKGAIGQGASLLLLAAGIKVLASAVEDFADLSWENVGKGLASISAILAAFAIFSRAMGDPSGIVRTGASLVLIGAAMKILASAMKDFGGLSWEEIQKGLLGMSGALAAIVAALLAMPPSTLASAASLVIVAGALGLIAKVMEVMSGLSWEEITKGLVVMGGALILIATATNGMIGAAAGAAAIFVVAGALAVLTPVLIALGQMSWGEIVKGLVALAGAFTIIGLAGLILSPVIPSLLGLGIAITLFGAGLALAGVGISAFAVGLTALAGAGAAGVAALVSMVAGIVQLIPVIVIALGEALIALVKVIAEAAPDIVVAVGKIIIAILDAIIEAAPKVYETFLELATGFLDVLVELVPKVASAVLDIMIAVLQTINENVEDVAYEMYQLLIAIIREITLSIPGIVAEVTNLIVAFLQALEDNNKFIIVAGTNLIISLINGIANSMVEITEAGVEAIISFISGVTVAINEHAEELQDAGLALAGAIVSGFTFGLSDKVGDVISAAGNLGRSAIESVRSVIDSRSPSKEFEKLGAWAAEGFAEGLVGGTDQVMGAWQVTTDMLRNAMEKSANDVDNLTKKLTKLHTAKELDIAAIEETSEALSTATSEHAKFALALDQMEVKLGGEKYILDSLSVSYDNYVSKIADADQALKDSISVREQYRQSIAGQYEDLPSIDQDTSLRDYINDLKYANADIDKFTKVLGKLRDLGLSDQVYEELLTKGPDILPFVEELLAGGVSSINTVNKLSAKLKKSASALGDVASSEMYDAGVAAAEGLLAGLNKQKLRIEKMMKGIARIIVDAVKRELAISSPSKVMHELGVFTIEGMAIGMKKTGPLLENAASALGKDALSAMKESISGLSDAINMSVDVNPTITPILDLSAIRKDAGEIDKLVTAQQLYIDAAYSKAKNAGVSYAMNEEAKHKVGLPSPGESGNSVIFNQTNNSPKALSSAEIYRQTKNQLSITKGALAPNAT